MEIIFNNAVCQSVKGRINRRCPWYIRERKGHFYAGYRGDKNTDIKHAWFRIFYRDLCQLQSANYISKIILTDEERRWLDL